CKPGGPAIMLKSLLRQQAPADFRARSSAPGPHPLDGPVLALYRADGTQSQQAFQQQTLPLFQALHRLTEQREPTAANHTLTALITTITRACHRASNHRLPKGHQVSDYRRFETLYNYALISAMAIAWYMDVRSIER